MAETKLKEAEEQTYNIQLDLQAIGIITYIIILSLLSRNIITNTRLIYYFWVIDLLLVFEFLNLLKSNKVNFF